MRWLSTLAALVPALALAGGTTTTRTGVLHGPLATSGITPACTDTAYDSSAPLDTRITQGCVLRCGVGVFDGSDAWQCVEGDGAQVTVQNPAGCTRTTNTPLLDGSGTQRTAFTKNGGCTDPNVNAADADTAGLDAVWTGAHTFVFVGAPERTAKPITSIQLSHLDSSNAGVLVQRSSSADKQQCVWYDAAGLVSVQQATANTPGSWIVASCRYDGTDDFFSRWNGNESTTNSAFTPDAPTTQPFFMGVREDGAEDVSGEMYEIRLYDRMLTAAEMTRLEALMMGAVMESRSVTVTRASAAFSLVGGKYHALGDDWPAVTTNGIEAHGQVVNYGADGLDVSAATDVGSPTDCAAGTPTNCDSASGPFSVFNGGAEADTLGDDDGAAYEGIRIFSETTYTGAITGAALVKEGTETGASIDISTDGTGSTTCTFSDLDATVSTSGGVVSSKIDGYTWISCSATIGGTPSATTVDLLVGDAAADTGTIVVSDREGYRLSYRPRPCPEVDGGASRTCAGDRPSTTVPGLPTVQGEWCVTYSPSYSDSTSTNLLFDTVSGGNGFKMWRAASERIHTEAWNGGASSSTFTTNLTWDPTESYRTCLRIDGDTHRVSRNGTLLLTQSGQEIVESHGGPLYLCNGGSASQQAQGSCRAVGIGR